MNIFTLKGRLQTKLLTYVVVAVLTLIFSGTTHTSYWPLFAVAVIVGLFLEMIWGFFVTYQPGYATWVFALTEYLVIAYIASQLNIPLSLGQATVYYWVTWGIVQLSLIYFLPIIRLSWGDDGGELW